MASTGRRTNSPAIAPPRSFWAWDEEASARLPEYPHRRQAVVKFLNALPDDPAQRRQAVAFLTRVGGGPLLRAVAGLSVDNAWVNDYLDAARINSVLTVGFGGAIVATIAVGMTMRSPTDEPPPDAAEPSAKRRET